MKQFVMMLLVLCCAAFGRAAEEVQFPVSALPEVWIAGKAPTAWAPGEVTVVECWATWCGPCVRALPHMEKLHKALKDERVNFIGVNVADRKTAEQVQAFLEAQPVAPTYPMAIDRENKLAQRLKFQGIPFAVVVREGTVVWRGHPMTLTEAMLRDLRDGKAPASESAKPKRIQPAL